MIRMNSSLNPEINRAVLPNSFEFNFNNQLERNATFEAINNTNGNLQIPLEAPKQSSDETLIQTAKLFRNNDQYYKTIPYEINKSRRLFDNYNGRNLSLLNSISDNSTNSRSVIYHKGQGNL